MESGSITWFDIATNTPPIVDYQSNELIKRSANVLVWGEGGWIQQTYYIHNAQAWFAQNQLPFEITHFAFINFPITENEQP